jgi:hypothetical protein
MGDVTPVLVAAVSSAGVIGAAVVAGAFQLRSLKREVKTNHGLRAGDYLEKIADVAEVSSQTLLKLEELGEKFDQHRIDDSLHFTLLHKRIDRMRGTDRTS